MKVIFLDIDGVLCTWRAHFAQGGPSKPDGTMCALDREAVGLLNTFAPHDVKFVICSTWRVNYSREWIAEHLRKNGFVGLFHADWRTPRVFGRISDGPDLHKGAEIRQWLEAHPEVTHYAIIDDQAKVDPVDEPHHVRPRYDDGYSWDNFRKTADLLGFGGGLPGL